MAAMDQHVANRDYGIFGSDMASALDMMEIDSPECGNSRIIDEVLPEAMLMEILSRLPDAYDLARCALVNRYFRSSFAQVKTARFICRHKHIFPVHGEVRTPFKETVTSTLRQLQGVENLRLEIEEKMQTKFKKDALDKKSLWLSEGSFVSNWLPLVSKTLVNLSLVDYGQQAIFRPSPLLRNLSNVCPNLQTLELRNMYLDCTSCHVMKKLKSLTLRCVKLTDAGLKDISTCMPNLDILTLVTVVGLKEAEFKSDNLKSLCLGLATKVDSVKLEVRSLIKLQLKMGCPEKLNVIAPNLKSLALCMGQNRILEFEQVTNLRELLMGAAEFSTLAKLSAANASLQKVFLDIPCMAFEESGEWKGVHPNVALKVPDMESIRDSCPNMQTLSVGPGLWHSFQESMNEVDAQGDLVLPKWPALSCLILHIIVINRDTSLALLRALMKAVPTLTVLEVYVHESSKVEAREFCQQLKHICQPLDLKLQTDCWKKGLKFGCFSF